MLKTKELLSKKGTKKVRRKGEIYVASDLSLWKTAEPTAFCQDVQINDTCYRRLDPEYFAWLRDRLVLAREAANSGRLDRDAYETLRSRFKVIEIWAIERFEERALLAAMRQLRLRPYHPPQAEKDVRRLDRSPQDRGRIDRAVRMVDAIRDEALRLGWREERLYRADGYRGRPSSTENGLVCYIGAGKRLGEVTRQWIEIIGPPPAEIRTRFYNPDVEQPWVRPVGVPVEK